MGSKIIAFKVNIDKIQRKICERFTR